MNKEVLPSLSADDFFGGLDRGRQVWQARLVPRWVFPFEPDRYEEFVATWTAVPEKERQKRFPLSPSDLEKILPFLWEKEGWLEQVPEQTNASQLEGHAKAGIRGTTLHELDALFHVVAFNMGGQLLTKVMPTVTDSVRSDKTLTRYQRITDGLGVTHAMGHDRVLQQFFSVIERRRNIGGLVEDGTPQLIGSRRFHTPSWERAYRYDSQELMRAEQRLAQAWARALMQPEKKSWEFTSARPLREAFVIASLDIPLQWKGMLDSVTRSTSSHGRQVVRVVDLKTGKGGLEKHPLKKEIAMRQMQVYVFLAERLASLQARLDQDWVRPWGYSREPGRPFHVKANSNSMTHAGRLDGVFIRRFDWQTGEMWMEELPDLSEARDEFLGWMAWLAEGINLHREELKRRLKYGYGYDLSQVKVPVKQLDFWSSED